MKITENKKIVENKNKKKEKLRILLRVSMLQKMI